MFNYSDPKEGFPSRNSQHRLDSMQVSSEKPTPAPELLQLLLFVDQRSSSNEQIRLLRKSLQELKCEYPFDLQVVDVSEQPYLAEHFKLVAIPTLIKIHPEPQQSLTGSNLIAQLKHSWPRWLRSVEEYWLSHPSELTSVDTNFQEIPSIASVSEIIQLSDEVLRLKQEKEQMQEQLQFKDRIIGMLAHDLRNPLTAASLALQTLEVTQKAKDTADPPSLLLHLTTPLIKQARQQLHTIEGMIADLLEASRGEKSQLNIQPQKLDIGCLCQEIVYEFEPRFHHKKLHIKTDIPHDLPTVYGDPQRIRQVMINLFDNAYKYTPLGGKIKLSIIHRTTQKVQVTLSDTGLGIPEEDKERIFEDHFRLERDRAEDGYGIGLALCQRIIRAHYGHIWVDSLGDKGSSFHFTLPVYRHN